MHEIIQACTHTGTEEFTEEAIKMAQCVKALATKLGDLSLNTKAHRVERTHSLKLCFDLHDTHINKAD